MAELPVIPGVSRVCLRWSVLNACNVLHFEQDDIDPEGLFSSLDAHVTPNMWDPLMQTNRIRLVEITPLDGASATQVFSPSDVSKWRGGISTGDYAPAVAACVSTRTTLRGKSFRGRHYLGPVAENQTTAGELAGASQSSLVSGWGSFLDAMNVASSPWVIASYKLATKTPITSIVVSNILTTQRRRQTRVGTG